ncbi:hypothetical protein J8F10_08845 [Gemmata sp. G18]|uniref:Uncharacterized protein n=1 Tax=Gemmata palustris TaxID=2822762 RepID=A0ABS5BNV1_9BACT|nr:hypothetical protein [Gemmata palustris]MBP3955386.1 hypothetical protein [Gemmata palustris]
MTGSRDADTDTITASQQDVIEPVLMANLEFDSGDLLAHSSLGNLVFDGQTYLGVGKFGGITAAEENSDLSRSPISLTLSNIPGDMGAIVLGEHYQGRRATIYLGYFDPATGLLVGDPVILYRGRMDAARIRQGQTFVVTVSIENRFAAWDKPKVRRYNNADQQSRHPGDKGCQYVEQAVEKEIVWGGKG